MSLAFQSATELAKWIREKQISSRELTQYYIDRIEKLDGVVNAVPVRDFERALQAAQRADDALANGQSFGPLHGLPLTIKEAFDVTGLPTTWGVPGMEKNIATADATVVSRFHQAGAHVIGKTNVPYQLSDFQTYNELFGVTNNPWDLKRTPGGSSGGAAAALAMDFTPLECGSDIGGSIRTPSHFTGVYGHKPTFGILPTWGHALPDTEPAMDLGVVGPMARSAEDLALALDLLAGPDHVHSRGWILSLPRPAKQSLSDFRIVVWPSDEMAPSSHAVAHRIQDVADRLRKAGATVSDTARPEISTSDAYRVFSDLLNGQLSIAMTDSIYKKSIARVAELLPTDLSEAAQSVRGMTQNHRHWLRTDEKRTKLRRAWEAFFEEWDILICPQMAMTAFPHDHTPFYTRTIDIDGEKRNYLRQIFWSGLIGVAYLPSTVFPTGPSAEGLPIGLQAVSSEFNDFTTIEFARLYSLEFGGFQPPPNHDS